MVIAFKDGEEIHGIVEWYDKRTIKVHRNDGPNLLIYKDSIKYIYKDPAYESNSEDDDR